RQHTGHLHATALNHEAIYFAAIPQLMEGPDFDNKVPNPKLWI
ncbi:13879_t:CDS:1, partial [Cetraspora pellucida]